MAPGPHLIAHPSADKSYFANPRLSDLEIVLEDRTVSVHRVILCRGSKYFESIINGRFLESGAKSIELHEDEPEAMMAMIRFIYGLPYLGEHEDWRDGKTLLPYALVHVVADKYQVPELKELTFQSIKSTLAKDTDGVDLVPALRVIFAGTCETEGGARHLMLSYCARHICMLRRHKDFMMLIAETPHLGAAIIGHEDFSPGAWDCGSDKMCKGKPKCPGCSVEFGKDEAWLQRNNQTWLCSQCGVVRKPICSGCRKLIRWGQRSL